MHDLPPRSPIESLGDFVSATRASFDRYLEILPHTEAISGVEVTTRLTLLKFDGNGRPMIDGLAECLYEHIIDYALAARHRPAALTAKDAARLAKEARKLFIHPEATDEDPDQTGEAGEILLYFLIEAVLGAPQVVAKMELKTNPRKELNGSDGIHMTWNPVDALVELYFGESKIYQDLGSAITAALKSIEAFHTQGIAAHELKMVTKHFKYADENVSKAVFDLVRGGSVAEGVRINHACLIGYDWKNYPSLKSAGLPPLIAEFRAAYLADAPRVHQLLQQRFQAFPHKHLRFDVLLLPFKSVQEFRDAFNNALD